MKKLPMKNIAMKKWIIIVLVLQMAALASIAGKREWIRNVGERVYLRTAPVDPNDMFRGDYVQLQYDITQPDTALLDKTMTKEKYQTVYLQLQRDARNVGTLKAITTKKPEGLFIKGQIDQHWDWSNNNLIKLGIEKYFIEQGSGHALEEKRGHSQEWQTPMEMEVALGSDGTAVIRDYRWSDMSIRLQVLEPATGNNNNRNLNNNNNNQPQNTATTEPQPALRISPKIRISVRNDSGKPLRFIDSAEHCAFTLVENQPNNTGRGQSYQAMVMPNRSCSDANAMQWQEQTLAPAQVYAVDIDLTEQQWHVLVKDKEQELGALQNSWSGYRWIYQLPESVQAAHAKQTDVWLSTLRTARFNASGRID